MVIEIVARFFQKPVFPVFVVPKEQDILSPLCRILILGAAEKHANHLVLFSAVASSPNAATSVDSSTLKAMLLAGMMPEFNRTKLYAIA